MTTPASPELTEEQRAYMASVMESDCELCDDMHAAPFTPEACAARLRAQVATLTDDVARLTHERNALGKAIGDAATAMGMVADDCHGLTGPDLLMFAEAFAPFVTAERNEARAEVERMRAVVEAVRAYVTTVDTMGAFGTDSGKRFATLRWKRLATLRSALLALTSRGEE